MVTDDDNDHGMNAGEIDPFKAVAFLHVQGMRGKEIAQLLFPKLKDPKGKISGLIGKGRSMRSIRETFDEACVSRDELAALRALACRDAYLGLQKSLSIKSGGCLRELRVFYSAPGLPNKNTWPQHLSRFADNCAWYVREQLDHSNSGIAVSWGATAFELIHALSRHQQSRIGDHRRFRTVPVIPTVGDPVGVSPAAGGISSTRLAKALSELLTGSSQKVPSLEGILPVLPRNFDEQKRMTIREYIELMKGYRDVFGSRDDRGAIEGKLAKVDTILTGAGAFQSWQKWGSELMVDSGVPVAELKRCCAGDIGGALVPLENVDSDPAARAEFERLSSLWTGITLEHFRAVAQRAANGAAPGVVLCAIGSNKAKIVHDLIVRFRVVNKLVVDPHLAKALEKL